MKYRIRFNKTRGLPGRGTPDHVWRVFDGEREYVVRNVRIDVPSWGEKEPVVEDWNIVCEGVLTLDRVSSTAVISRGHDD